VQILKTSKKPIKRWFGLLLTLHVLIIPSSEFAGMNFQEHLLAKLMRKYGKVCVESEFQKSVLCCCS